MRKQLVILLMLCLLLAGCANDAPAENPDGQDAQNQFMATGVVSFQETEGYFLGSNFMGRYLHYFDKATGISGVLCADPSCGHDTSACGAYMDIGATVSIYDGKLYWIAPEGDSRDNYLWRSDLFGMNREKLKKLSFEDFIIKYQPQQYVVHRGMLYILGDSNTVNVTQAGNWLTVVATPLDDSQEFTVLHEASIEQGVQRIVRFIGNDAYVSLIIFAPGGGMYDLSVEKLDLNTGECETIYTETGMTVIPGDLWVTEQGEMYLPGADDHFTYFWKIEDGKRVEIKRWEASGPSIPDVFDGIATYQTLTDGVRYIDIVDLNGEQVYSGKLFPEEIPGLPGDPNAYSFANIGGDRDKLIFNLQDHTDMQSPQDYTILLDINNNMKATVLWSTGD